MEWMRARLYLIALALIVGLLVACSGSGEETESSSDEPTPTPMIGSPARGRQLILNYGCGACHTIPGIPGANTHVGPDLNNMDERRYIAGSLINTRENMARWIENPKAVEPNTAMPDIGVSQQEAQDIVAYLYSLEQR